MQIVWINFLYTLESTARRTDPKGSRTTYAGAAARDLDDNVRHQGVASLGGALAPLEIFQAGPLDVAPRRLVLGLDAALTTPADPPQGLQIALITALPLLALVRTLVLERYRRQPPARRLEL